VAAIATIDREFGVFEGTTFKVKRWARWLAAHGIPWPRLESGTLALDDDTFKEMARRHPVITPMRELRVSLSKLRLNDLAVGHDGRNRCLLSAFNAKSSRNLPSSKKFIFGPAVWIRGLIRPEPGMAVAYIDYAQQEFGIAAALSGDPAMLAAYMSGDPYLEFAKQAGAVPSDGTREAHGAVRELFKTCALGVQYGMGVTRSPRASAEIERPRLICCGCTAGPTRGSGGGATRPSTARC
jgi:DNA polymerase-1